MKMTGSPAKVFTFVASLLVLPTFLAAAPNDQKQPASGKTAVAESAPSKSSSSANDRKWTEAYGNLPLAFEKNLGQTDPQVQFLSRGSGYEIFLTPAETVLALHHAQPGETSPLTRPINAKEFRERLSSEKASVIRIQIKGANPHPAVSGLDKLPGKTDYFIGSNPKNWRTDVPSFARVQYHDVYPGIDLVFYGNNRHFEYDYVVAPGADPQTIALNLTGEQKLSIDRDGNLMMHFDNGSVEMRKPVVYQTVNGEHREVAARYVLAGKDQVSFAVGAYDKAQPLVIDPVVNYSTYLGGSTPFGDVANGIAVDAAGDAYVTGQTFSSTFPTVGAYQTSSSMNANGSVFVTEMNPAGTAVLYSTYLSGTGANGELGTGIAVDPAPSAACLNGSSAPGVCMYVTGLTSSTDFPTTSNGLIQSPLGSSSGTAFISKINPALSGMASLVYSSYIGGTNGDYANGIAVDANANAYVAGYTNSTPGSGAGDFTVVGGFQSTLNSPNGNAFLIRIDTTQSGTPSLIYSTYLGGSGTGSGTIGVGDSGLGVAVDSAHNAYITGVTTSSDFPTTTANAYVPTLNLTGGGGGNTAFVARIDTTQTGMASLIYSTYLASTTATAPLNDLGNAITLGPGNVAYVTGQTSSNVFPTTESGSTAGQFPSPPSGAGVVFVSLINTTKSGTNSLTYSTLLGGTGGDNGLGIRTDGSGNAYVTGVAVSQNFPITAGAFQNTLLNTTNGDAFIAEIAPNGNGAADLIYSTYFGGSDGAVPDRAYGIALDSSNNVYIAGQTGSDDFPIYPTGSAYQPSLGGMNVAAGFVAKLTLEPTVVVSPTSLSFSNQIVGITSTAQTVTLTNNGNVALTISAPPSASMDFGTTANTCSGSIAPGATCTVGVTFTPSTTPSETGTLTFTDSNSLSNTGSPQTVALNGTSIAAIPTVNPSPSLLTFTSQTVNTTSPAQTVTITDTGNVPITMSTPSISITGDYGQTNTCDGVTLQPSPGTPNSCTVGVTFTPTSASNPRTGTLSIADDATGSPQSVSLTGTGTALTQTVSVSTPSLTFGSQVVGTMSAAQTVTVTNTGTGPVTMSTPSISIAPTGDFTETNNCDGVTLQASPGTPVSCTISVKFTPTSASNPRTAVLSIADNATGTPQTVTLTGTGVTQTVTVSQPSLTFGSQVVGTMSAAQTVTVTNNGTGPVTMSTPSISVTGDFSQTNTCDGITLQPSPGTPVSCTISVKFTPTSASNPRTGTLSIADNATGSPQTVSLTGTGVATTQTVSASPTPLTFTSQIVGTTSPAQTVTVSNTGNSAVTMSTPSISITGDFSQTNTCDGVTLQPSPGTPNSCTISVKFTPTSATNPRTGTLSIADNATGSPQMVNLTGTGVAATQTVSASPTPLTFGSQTVGTSSAAQTVTVTNTGNTAVTLGASAVAISGDFAVSTTTCTNNMVLQPSPATPNSCAIGVTFTPTSASNPRTGTLSVTDNATGSPQTVSLTGTGVAAVGTVSVTPTGGLTFGSQSINTTSTPQTVTVANSGTVPVTLGATALAISGDFAVSTTTCTNNLVLQPSPGTPSSCTIGVTFTPTSMTNPRTGTLTIADNASSSPQMVSLTGTASATTPDFSFSLPSGSVTTTPGASVIFTVDVVSIGGYTTPVTFTCTGMIPQGACIAPTGPVTPSAAPGTPATFLVSTKGAVVVAPFSERTPPMSMRQFAFLALAALMLLVLPATRKLRTRFALVGAMATFIVLAGCSSFPTTTAGTYTLTVTGTSGSLSHSSTVTVTISQ